MKTTKYPFQLILFLWIYITIFFIFTTSYGISPQAIGSNDEDTLERFFTENGILYDPQVFMGNDDWRNRYPDKSLGRPIFSSGRIIKLQLRGMTQSQLDLSPFSGLKVLSLLRFTIGDLQLLDLPASLKELTLISSKLTAGINFHGFTSIERLALIQCKITPKELNALPRNLVELNLSGNNHLIQVDLQHLGALKSLDLTDCGIMDLSLSRLPWSLNELDVSDNSGVRTISLASLKNLKIIKLQHCGLNTLRASTLPAALRHLSLSHNPLIRLDLGVCQKLETLNLSACNLTKIKASDLPTSLKELHLNNNLELKVVNLNRLKNLKKLFIYECRLNALLIDELTGLKELHLSRYKNLETIDFSRFKRLKKLTLMECGIKDLRNLNLPRSLEELNISGNIDLETVALKHLTGLKSVNLSHCSLRRLDPSYLPTSLVELDLKNNNISQMNTSFKYLRKLKRLNLSGGDIVRLDASWFPSSLSILVLDNSKMLTTITITKHPNLTKLSMQNCDLTELTLASLPALEELRVRGNQNLKNMALDDLRKLKVLDASDCFLNDFKAIRLPTSLVVMSLYGNSRLKSIQLKHYPQLKKIDLQRCTLAEVELSDLPELEELYLGSNEELEKIELRNFPNLKIADLFNCNIKTITLSGMPLLYQINLSDNPHLDNLRVPVLDALKILKLSGCGIRKLPLPRLTNLLHLDLSYNRNLSLISLTHCENLTVLNLFRCNHIKLLPGLSLSPSIMEVDVRPNHHIRRLDFTGLKNLKKLYFSKVSPALKEILLDPDNKDYPGVTRIKLHWENDQTQVEELLDEWNKPVDHPVLEYAQKHITYRGGREIQTIRYTTADLKRIRADKNKWYLYLLRFFLPCGTGIYFIMAFLFLRFYPSSASLQERFRHTGWKKIFALPIKLYTLFGKKVCYRLLSPFISGPMSRDAELDEASEQTAYFSGSHVVEFKGIRYSEPVLITHAIEKASGIIVLKGSSGLGKTMFARRLFSMTKERGTVDKQVPVFLLADQCKAGVTALIKEKLKDSLFTDDKEIENLVNNKTLTVFIDGLNEASPTTRKRIREFTTQCKDGDIFLTMQLIDWEIPPGAREFKLMPLELDQIEAFLVFQGASLKINDRDQRNYEEKCKAWTVSIKGQLADRSKAEVLSNPMNLNVLAQLIAASDQPTDIQTSDFFRQLYRQIETEYEQRFKPQRFRLLPFAGHIFQWAIQVDDYRYLPQEIIDIYQQEIAVMASPRFKVLIRLDDKYDFKHDKFKIFFLGQWFMHQEHWKNNEYVKHDRFHDVYLELAHTLPFDEARQLKKNIWLHGTDNTFLDEFVKVLKRRPDYPSKKGA